jgi:threonine dehydratase
MQSRTIPGASRRLTSLVPPTFSDVLEARKRISAETCVTPLRHSADLTTLVGAEVWVKHENFQVTGAFKVRGGINLISRLVATDARPNGVIAASTGNHGQSIAYAAALFGVPCTICVPKSANPLKVSAIQNMGAEVISDGVDFDEARERAAQLAVDRGLRYVHSGDEPDLIAGVATATFEVLSEVSQVDSILVPVGGGSGAAAACLVRAAMSPDTRIIGVQSAAAPAAFKSWQERSLIPDRMGTVAEGLATRTPFALPQQMLQAELEDFILVSDGEILKATATMIRATRTLVEPAGAAPLAAALKLRSELAGQRIVLMCSGGNIGPDQLREVAALV